MLIDALNRALKKPAPDTISLSAPASLGNGFCSGSLPQFGAELSDPALKMAWIRLSRTICSRLNKWPSRLSTCRVMLLCYWLSGRDVRE